MENYFGEISEKPSKYTINECEPWRKKNSELSDNEDELRSRFNRCGEPYIPSNVKFFKWLKSIFK